MNTYRLIVFGDDWDVYQIAYKNLIDNPRVVYIPTFRPKGILGLIQRIQFNPRLNRIVSLPFKSIWNRFYLRHVHEKRLCFLVFENWLRLESEIKLLPFLKRNYKDAKVVCFTQDLIDRIKDHYTRESVDAEHIKRYSDLCISYDVSDAKRYAFEYHPTVFSVLQLAKMPSFHEVDLYFLGRDKGRLPMLIDISREAKRRRLVCRFVLIDVPEEKRIQSDGIIYLNGNMSYSENLYNCANSRCIVELLQKQASSPTFRVWETITLNKKLLTNNTNIVNSEFYDERYISTFHDCSDIDWNFVEEEQKGWENPFKEQITPINLIRYIEGKLNVSIDI